MNLDEGRDIVRRIQVGWPIPEIPAATAELWARILTKRDYEHAKLAVEALLETEHRQPHVSHVIDKCSLAEGIEWDRGREERLRLADAERNRAISEERKRRIGNPAEATHVSKIIGDLVSRIEARRGQEPTQDAPGATKEGKG